MERLCTPPVGDSGSLYIQSILATNCFHIQNIIRYAVKYTIIQREIHMWAYILHPYFLFCYLLFAVGPFSIVALQLATHWPLGASPFTRTPLINYTKFVIKHRTILPNIHCRFNYQLHSLAATTAHCLAVSESTARLQVGFFVDGNRHKYIFKK